MSYKLGKCHCYKSGVMHPLTHLLLHVGIGELALPSRGFSVWRQLHEHYREARFGRDVWCPPPNRHGVYDADALFDWVERNPPLLEWFGSESCFVSPETWPSSVAAVFSPLPTITPWEYANGVPPAGDHRYIYRSHDPSLLWCYSAGMSLQLLGVLLGQSESTVIRTMETAAQRLKEHGPFVMWALNISPVVLDLTAGTRMPLFDRLRVYRYLERNPLLAPRALFDPILQSREFWRNSPSTCYARRGGNRRTRAHPLVARPRSMGVFNVISAEEPKVAEG